ncbi:MAG TPA: hypothetical protein PLQ13_02805 [Candidatus Krumholzibacteria bacterium]|nr:hypothetical protein [Candidatus Krumholzibacteria bacterium]
MRDRNLSRLIRPAVLSCLVLLAPAALSAPRTAALKEAWRAGGEDDEILFGSVGGVTVDTEGHVLVLDSQLSQVHVYGADGTHLSTLGREGDGPGEVRRPGGMFVRPSGDVALVQGFPGRIVLVHADGTPAGESSYTPPGGPAAGQFAVIVRAFGQGEGMVLAGIRMTFGGGSQSKQTYFLAECDANGAEQHVLLQKEHTVDYADFRLDEGAMDFVWQRLAVGPDGRVYVAPERGAYAIRVFGPDGAEQRVLTRDYTAPARDARQQAIARKVIEAVGANYPAPLKGVTIEDTEAAVAGLFPANDGSLWVATGRSGVDVPAGCWIVLDRFGADGAFAGQVALPGAHDPDKDALFILPDNRVVVVTGALDAWLNQQAVGAESAAEEAEPLEVICYTME